MENETWKSQHGFDVAWGGPVANHQRECALTVCHRGSESNLFKQSYRKVAPRRNIIQRQDKHAFNGSQHPGIEKLIGAVQQGWEKVQGTEVLWAVVGTAPNPYTPTPFLGWSKTQHGREQQHYRHPPCCVLRDKCTESGNYHSAPYRAPFTTSHVHNSEHGWTWMEQIQLGIVWNNHNVCAKHPFGL